MFDYLMLGDVRARKYSKTSARTRSILEKFAFDTTLLYPSWQDFSNFLKILWVHANWILWDIYLLVYSVTTLTHSGRLLWTPINKKDCCWATSWARYGRFGNTKRGWVDNKIVRLAFLCGPICRWTFFGDLEVSTYYLYYTVSKVSDSSVNGKYD